MGKLIERMKNTRSKATSALTVAGVSAMTGLASVMPAWAGNLSVPADAGEFSNLFGKFGTMAMSLFAGLRSIAGPIALMAAGYFHLLFLLE